MTFNPADGWRYEARLASFGILPHGNGRWQIWFNDESLGSYHSPVAALDDLVGGYCISNSQDLDFARMGLPSELSEWVLVRS